jgi:hypothetical protein
MSRADVEIVREAMGLNRSGDSDELVSRMEQLVATDFEFRSRLMAVEGRAYKGLEGVRAYRRDIADAFSEWNNETVEIIAISPGVVLVEVLFRGTGQTSGMTVELPGWIAFCLTEGKITRVFAGSTREEVLAESGLGG